MILFGQTALEVWRYAALIEACFLGDRDERWQRGDFSDDELPWNAASVLLSGKRICVYSETRISGRASACCQAADAAGLSYPIHVFSPTNASRVSTKTVRGHLFSCCLGRPLFVRFRPDVLLPVPELVVAQCAQEGSEFEALAVASELASIYSRSSAGDLLYRPSLLSRDSLASLAGELEGLRRSSNLRFAARYMASRARSPREEALFNLLTLPYGCGGYKLPAPNLNADVLLGAVSRKVYRASKLECDLLWRDYKVAVFYESDAHHLTPAQLSNDAKRDSALAAEGFTVMRISNHQMKDIGQMNAWASALAKKLNKAIRPSIKDYARRQRSLRVKLRI